MDKTAVYARKHHKLFCHIDDFCQNFEKQWHSELLENGLRQRRRQSQMALSEMLTLMVYFHQSHYRDFKAYYSAHVHVHLNSEFPSLLSYNRFVQRLHSFLIGKILATERRIGLSKVQTL